LLLFTYYFNIQITNMTLETQLRSPFPLPEYVAPHRREKGVAWPISQYNAGGIQVNESLRNAVRVSMANGLGKMSFNFGDDRRAVELQSLIVSPEARASKHLEIASTLMGVLKGYIEANPSIEHVNATASNEATIALMAQTFGSENLQYAGFGEIPGTTVPFPGMTEKEAIDYLAQIRVREYPDDPTGSRMLTGGIRVLAAIPGRGE
jgi:hypothetical protein